MYHYSSSSVILLITLLMNSFCDFEFSLLLAYFFLIVGSKISFILSFNLLNFLGLV
jgi:hypothetical protein